MHGGPSIRNVIYALAQRSLQVSMLAGRAAAVPELTTIRPIKLNRRWQLRGVCRCITFGNPDGLQASSMNKMSVAERVFQFIGTVSFAVLVVALLTLTISEDQLAYKQRQEQERGWA